MDGSTELVLAQFDLFLKIVFHLQLFKRVPLITLMSCKILFDIYNVLKNLKTVPQIPRSLLYSIDPEDQDKVAEYRKNIRQIRQNNLCERYKNEYELALAKKREQENQNKPQLDQSKKFDFDF